MTRATTIPNLILALAVVGVGLLAAPRPVLAGPESDIPGIPLPASVVTGQLGGSIYDVVYRLDVPPGSVIVAGLEGSPGTDFDLYLFDASATTVVANIGVLTKSTGNTSSEHLSWPTRLGGTFYLDLNGATDVQGTYTLSAHIVADPTPPTATLFVAGGATRVNTQFITLQLVAFDDLSGVTEMSLSGDGINYLPPVAIQGEFPWILPEGDGPKRVWVRVFNGVGLASVPASVSVELDTTGPTITTISPSDTVVSTARPTISVQFDEAIDVATWSKLGLIVQSPSGGIVPGDYTYYPSIATGTFTPSADLAIGSTYIVTVGDVRDLAGNRVRDAASWTIRRLLATSVSLAAKPTVLVSGGSVSLSLTADLPTGEPVILESRPGGVADFVTQQSILPIDGHYVRTFVPQSNLTFRATYPGSATSAASNSAEVRILVRRKVWMAGPGPATTRRSVTGTSLTLAAQVAPAGVASVSFRLYRYDARIGGYRYAGSLGRRTDASGRATVNWDAPAGRFYWRVAVLSSPTFANNMTLPYRFDIRR